MFRDLIYDVDGPWFKFYSRSIMGSFLTYLKYGVLTEVDKVF